ncbi:hypothetical protein [Sphingosinicella terrae]|uniref:hypothetical protein n=1 Tax=Sphingosinicella terrae TaxID=2172047 RepID=UPI0013B3C6CC|nr:hypothetical protein [Sphingosinicella terrae]
MPVRILGMIAAAAAVGVVAVQAAAAGQGHEAQAKVEEAGRLIEQGDRRGEIGDRGGRIRAYRRALALVDEAIALGDTRPEVVLGRREFGLMLGDHLLEAERPEEALAAFGEIAASAGGGVGADIPEDRQDRLHLARALRGMVFAAAAAGDFGEARARLGALIAVGRAMQAAEPDNLYLARRLAQDLENEVFFRWVTEDGPGARESALEVLALFRQVDEANPGSDEAMRSHFRWAYVAAALHEDDAALWAEARTVGERLRTHGGFQAQDEDHMRVVRRRTEG